MGSFGTVLSQDGLASVCFHQIYVVQSERTEKGKQGGVARQGGHVEVEQGERHATGQRLGGRGGVLLSKRYCFLCHLLFSYIHL
jgi:hypothetical protein